MWPYTLICSKVPTISKSATDGDQNLKPWLKCHISQLIILQRNTLKKKKKNQLIQKKLPRRNANAAELLPPRTTSNAAASSIHFEFPAKPIRPSEKPCETDTGSNTGPSSDLREEQLEKIRSNEQRSVAEARAQRERERGINRN